MQPFSFYEVLAHFQHFSIIISAEMKLFAHKAFSLLRAISLGFSEVELLGQSLNISKALDT